MKRMLSTFITTAAAVMLSAPASADDRGLRLSVEPLVTQFDVRPGGQASTPVTIANVGSETALVNVTPIDWRTTLDGDVKTYRPGTNGETSLDPFMRLATESFVLSPGAAEHLTLSLAVPSVVKPGLRDMWGGYSVRAVRMGTTKETFGVGATILVYETLVPSDPHVHVTALHVIETGRRDAQIVARMINDGNRYARPQIHVLVAQGARVVVDQDDSTAVIFAGDARMYRRALHDLAPGTYALQLTVDYGGSSLVQATTRFTIQ